MDTVIKNCKLADRNGEFYIGIESSKIAKISKTPIKADNVIDIKSNYLMPGFIDPHVHFRDPGLTQKEDFKSGSEAAAHGGFTTVIDMPNTLPKANTYKALKEKFQIADKKSIVNVYLQAGVNDLCEMEKMLKLNPIAFKIFMDLEDNLNEIFNNLSGLNKLVALHCEDREIVRHESERLKDSTNPIDYSYARPSKAEDKSVELALKLARKNNLRLHICHLSSRKSLELVRQASLTQNVSWEFTPHHLFLTNEAYNTYGNFIKTNPPLRPNGENITLNDLGEKSIIGTDHAPHTIKDKSKGVWDSSPGIPALDTAASLLLTEVNRGNIDLKLIPKILSENAAKIYNLNSKGQIAIGKDADLTVVDMKRKGKFDVDEFYTKAKYSPFDNWEYQGKSVMTIVNGKVTVDEL